MPNNLSALVEPIAKIIEQARGQVRQAVNSAMVHSYWHIGEMIVEQEAKPFTKSYNEYMRNPDVLEFLNLQDNTYQGHDFKDTILSNIQQFLLELGKGFAFVERQQRIRFADEDFFIDLVFYNFKLKCFLLVDLKLGKLKHQDIGQMDTYVRLYDEQHKGSDDNPTIGLVLCSEKSEAVVKYSVLSEQKQLFSAKYLPYLPTEEQLKHELERERANAMAQLAAKEQDNE